MYPNLNAELSRKGLKRKDLAVIFGNRVPSVSDKLNGKSPISLEEAIEIKRTFFPEFTLDYLFETANVFKATC